MTERPAGIRRLASVLIGASALMTPHALQAKTSREAELEARVARLEAEIARIGSALETARGDQAAVAVAREAAASSARSAVAAQESAVAAAARSDDANAKLTALASKPQPDGMRSDNSTIKIGGFIKLIGSTSNFRNGAVPTNSLGRDFYLPQAIAIGGRRTTDTDFSAKQTRFWLNLGSTVAGHQVKGYLEADFQVNATAAPGITGGGTQRTTNGYTPALRRAWVQVDRLLIGQEWTTFQYVAALPESTDYVGATEGTVFIRQPQVRYSQPLSKSATLSVAIENPESATATAGAAPLIENGADHLPDLTARLALVSGIGEFSLAGLVRQIRIEGPTTGLTRGGYGISAGGKIWLNAAKTGDVRFMLTYGRDISRYVGLSFAPDAVYAPSAGRLEDVNVFAALGAVRLPLTSRLRANLIGSFQSVDYADTLALASISNYNRRAFSLAANLFYSPFKNVDFGLEYRHGERELVSGLTGRLDRVEFAAKYGF